MDQLLAANPQISNPNLIVVGQRISVPGQERIAAANATTASALIAANGIVNADMIYPGDTLVIPGAPAANAAEPAQGPVNSVPVADGSYDYSQIVGVAGNANVTPAFIAEV